MGKPTKVETNYDFCKNQVKNFVHDKRVEAPSQPEEGQEYYNTLTNKKYYWNGTKWVEGILIASDVEAQAGVLEDVAINPKQMKLGLDEKQDTLLYTAEDSSNKVTSISSTSTNTQYPSAKLIYDLLLTYASLTSPNFTGTPTVPTALAGDNSTQIANTAFVVNALANLPIGGGLKVETYQNTELTPVNGVCTWNITHTIGSTAVICEIYEISTGDKVVMSTNASSSTGFTIQFNSTSVVSANTYKAVLIGG